MNRVRLSLAILMIACALCSFPSFTRGAPQIPQRLFYLSSSNTLSSQAPSGDCAGTSVTCSANVTTTPLTFNLQSALQSPATIYGPIIFSLWANFTNLTGNNSVTVSMSSTFSYRYPGGSNGWTNTNSSAQRVFGGATNFNITLQMPATGTPLIDLTSIAVEIAATKLPPKASIMLGWGSAAFGSYGHSYVLVPMSQYETLFTSSTSSPVSVLDRSDTPTTYFSLNAAPGNNIVVIKVFVLSAMGITDIARVNMTIVDQTLKPVRGASNATMQQATSTSPYQFVASWVYPSNSTQGTYQIWIDIIDSQGNVASSFRGPASFGLVPPGFIPFPYNLWPYFTVGGGVIVAGVFFYRRRRGKNYLIPFEHFNTLTGGQLPGGTIVDVEGNTGSGKSLLLEQLMGEDLRAGKPCVFVSTSDFPSSIRSNMKSMGYDVSGYEANGQLAFVDGYSAEAGQMSREKVAVPSLGDLTTLGIKITSVLPEPDFKGGSLFFDSLTPLASKAKPESIVSFVQSVGARVKGLHGRAFFALGLGIDGTVQRQLEDSADCIVQMEAFEESGTRKRRLRIAKFRARGHQEGWALFTIEGGKGIIFYSRKPRK